MSTFLVEGHVFLVDDQSTHALLSVPRAELVSYLGSTHLAHKHLKDVTRRDERSRRRERRGEGPE